MRPHDLGLDGAASAKPTLGGAVAIVEDTLLELRV